MCTKDDDRLSSFLQHKLAASTLSDAIFVPVKDITYILILIQFRDIIMVSSARPSVCL